MAKGSVNWVPVTPTERQKEALDCDASEVLYGGAAGGGKSVWLLMEALQWVDEPAYRAIIFRRTFGQLNQSGGLIELSQDWLAQTPAVYNVTTHCWTFPSGAKLFFSGMQYDSDKTKQQGARFHFVGWDELTHFEEAQYRYLFSRRRRGSSDGIPLRFRATANPGGIGHDWVKARFIDGDDPKRSFISARIDDNPHLDAESYRESLAELSPVERAWLEHGDWNAKPDGGFFKRAWFKFIDPDEVPPTIRWTRYWDMAATETKPGKDPAYTAGVKMGLHEGVWYVADVKRGQLEPHESNELVKSTAEEDGRAVTIVMEQEPGSAGKRVIDDFSRNHLIGFTFYGDRPTGPKTERAKPLAAAAYNGNVKLVRGNWNGAFLDEAVGFPQGHKDQVDAASGAMGWLKQGTSGVPSTGGKRIAGSGNRLGRKGRVLG